MTVGTGSKPISKMSVKGAAPVGYGEDPMRQLLLCKWERDAPDAGPAHCTLQYTRPCGRVKCSLWSGVTFVNPYCESLARSAFVPPNECTGKRMYGQTKEE